MWDDLTMQVKNIILDMRIYETETSLGLFFKSSCIEIFSLFACLSHFNVLILS